MCIASVSVSTAEKKSFFSKLRNMFHLKRKEEEKKTTTMTMTTTTTTPAATTKGELERVFTYFDENGDGKVSAAELRRCVKAVGGKLTEEAEMAGRLSDSDGDELLGMEDFTKLMEGMEDERNKESELVGAFTMYEDMEGSGYITPKSLKRMLSRLGESTSIENCKAMISRFDINGDGVLGFDEFQVTMTT
ncbi:putative calcium-binding protein CML19 [Capsicum baccatum]|uniref:Calcium-binding protein CML19 n=1 Tax=Capsicum baccatum TaxID=33114 RepID=A0A2G2VPM0_CAPBA|nr:putative calcium-binding protein CML19 [Capsicum baccatum]